MEDSHHENRRMRSRVEERGLSGLGGRLGDQSQVICRSTAHDDLRLLGIDDERPLEISESGRLGGGRNTGRLWVAVTYVGGG